MLNHTKTFHLEIDEPIAIAAQPASEERKWGRWQFPGLCRTAEGHILASYEYGTDSYQYEATLHCKVSEDEGKTWRPKRDDERPAYTKMPNGKYFVGFVRKGCYQTDYLDAYTPICEHGNRKWYLADDIAEDIDKKVYAQEYDPKTGNIETFECTILWPNMPLMLYPGKQIYPATMMFALHNEAGIHIINGDLYYLIYWAGFDMEETDRDRLADKAGPYHAYLFKSSDCGHTWKLYSQILSEKESFLHAKGYEGYAEPHMAKMPDDSWTMLIRTGGNHTSLIARSVDDCKTWTKPAPFDTIGVLPQILPLACGVTLASYGRPEMRLRATSDPTGQQWEDPITVELSDKKPGESCYYTKLLPLDDNSALFVYSDFQYPDADGNRVKAIMARKIHVIFDEKQ